MDSDASEINELLKQVHEFSPEEKEKLEQLHNDILYTAQYVAKEKSSSLAAKVDNCWPQIVKLVALHLAIRTDEMITERALNKWFADVQKCLDQLSDLLQSNKLSRYGIWLLELHRASNIAPDKDLAEAVVMKSKVGGFIKMFCQAIDFLNGLISEIRRLFPSKGGRRKNVGRVLLSQGIERVFSAYDIPVSTGKEDTIAVLVIEQILSTFAAENEKVGTPRHYLQNAKKGREELIYQQIQPL